MLEARANDNRPLVVGFTIAVGLHLFVGVPVIARSFGIGDPTAMFTHSDARDEAERRRKERLAQALQEHQDNPPDPDEIPELIPGLEDGSETSMAWIGADEYQEHMARLGQVDQGGFRINDSGGGARVPGPPQSGPDAPPGPPEQPQPVAAATPPSPELAREPQPTPPEPTAPQPTPAQQAPAPDAPAAQPSAPPIEAVRPATPVMPPEPMETPGTARPTPEPPPTEVPSGSDLPPAEPDPSGTAPPPLERPITPDPAPQPAPTAPQDPARTPEPNPRDTPPNQPPQTATPSSPTEPSPPPAPPQEPNPARAETPPAPQVQPGAGGATTPSPSGVIGPGDGPGRPDPGQRSDRESDATSVINVPPEKWRTGAPIAHKGVEILTRRPELPILTRLTTRPLHPVADLFFDNQGKPVSVKIVQSSGYPDDIDQPVIDALYRWRAKGSQLARLPEGKVARFRVRVILD